MLSPSQNPYARSRLIKELESHGKSKRLKLNPFPVRVAYTAAKGLHLVASRSIQINNVVLVESPLSLALLSQYELKYCSACLASLSGKEVQSWRSQYHTMSILCDGCRYNRSLRDLHALKPFDFSLQQNDKNGVRETALYGMYWRAVMNWSEARAAGLDEDEDGCVLTHDIRHAAMLASDGIGNDLRGDFQAISAALADLFAQQNTPITAADLSMLFEVMLANQETLLDSTKQVEIGRAIYPATALINHACRPNCAWEAGTSTQGLMRITATAAIEKGEEITIAYVNPQLLARFETVKERRQCLMQERRFLCACSDCRGVCGHCDKPQATASCGACRSESYCSSECQKQHWPSHKLHCAIVKSPKMHF